MTRLLSTTLLFLLLVPLAWAADLPDKHPLDKSESRTVVLENGLRVLLVSDPELDISAASMAINVGSYVNPEGTQGLAHYLEHMLFLGTEKYPDEGEYAQYVRQNGGYTNAYTAGDHTNYHFQIYPDALEGAIDRFAQFFIAPLFTEEFSERELNALESEFQKNLENDDWRGQRLFRMHTREDHPENHFSTGNKETLANARRDELIAFYNDHYSANQMALSLVSNHSLDQMEAWVREYFGEVKNKDIETLRYPDRYLELDGAMQVIQMDATQDRRQLTLYFNTPSIREDWDAKSSQLIGSILGYEGEGSLLSQLKAENLATSLGAGVYEGTIDYTTTAVGIELTAEGLEQWERVVELVMGYIELMRQSPYPDYFWEERATMARLAEIYTDKGEGAERAVELANRALTLPLEVAEDAPAKFLRQDPDFYFEVLDHLTPDNLMVLIKAKDVGTDAVEPIYGTHYSHKVIADGLYERLQKPVVASAFSLPKPNPFVPENVGLLAERPVLLIDEPGLSLYYGQDREFQRPKVAMAFRVRIPAGLYSDETAVLMELYEAAVQEYVNEIAYDALMAELSYNIEVDPEGVKVSLFGYTESAGKLLPYLLEALRDFRLSEDRFLAVKDRLVRGWENARYDNAFMYVRFFNNKASLRNYLLPDEKAEIAAGLGLDEVYALRDRLYGKGHIEALVYGNMTASESITAARSVQKTLGLEGMDPDGLYRTELVSFEPGQSVTYKDVLPGNNSVFRKDYMIGLATPERRVAAAVLANLTEAPYYSEMRTRQQLGYVVWSFVFNRKDELRLGFVIQSGEYDPLELVKRSDTLVADMAGMLREMPAEAFQQAKEAVRSEIEVKPKTIAEKAANFFALAYEHGANWERKKESLEALDQLDLEDVVAILEEVNDPSIHRYQLVLLFARQHEELAESADGLTDLDAWRKDQSFRTPTDL